MQLPVLSHDTPLGRAEQAAGVLKSLLREGRPLCVAWSGGKDSSAALNLVIVAAAELHAAGEEVPPIIVTHGDTLIENPEISLYAHAELARVSAFADRHGLDVRIHVATPSIAQSWMYRTIGQGKLPTFPGDIRECSVEFKVKPQSRVLRSIMGELRRDAAGHEPVVIIGTRFSESTGREERMKERGESATEIRQGAYGFDYLSPIADWTIKDVWYYLGTFADLASLMGGTGDLLCYSDFTETLRIYADATGAACGIGGDLNTESTKRAEACGARFGCSLCTAVGRDKSLETMIAANERYAYMAPLNRLQRFLLATRWDWTRRSWLGRSINEHGYQRIQPDVYSPAMTEELLRYCLTIDIEEAEAADRLGIEPRFRLLSPELLVAIDAEWSRYGQHRPFHALKILLEVQNGARYPVPELEEVPRTPRPAARYTFVGKDWDQGGEYTFTGLRSVWEMFEECPAWQTTTLSDGLTVLDVPLSEQFDVDPESAALILGLEAERLVAVYHDDPFAGPTRAYEYYLGVGALSLNARQRKNTDEILRRTNFRARMGLAGPSIDIDAILAETITETEMKRRAGIAVIPEADLAVGRLNEQLDLLSGAAAA